ncbi:MAG: AtpZ/AtpI family protein [Leptospirales bacterium]|nr:AtpZ/AtpI family protein [Leptospirales bacterium]
MKGGGFLGVGFEFIGIAGLFTAGGIYLDARWNGRGLILVGCIVVGVAAGIWHLIRRVNAMNQELSSEAAERKARKTPLTPEENLKRLDDLTKSLADLTESRRKKSNNEERP